MRSLVMDLPAAMADRTRFEKLAASLRADIHRGNMANAVIRLYVQEGVDPFNKKSTFVVTVATDLKGIPYSVRLAFSESSFSAAVNGKRSTDISKNTVFSWMRYGRTPETVTEYSEEFLREFDSKGFALARVR